MSGGASARDKNVDDTMNVMLLLKSYDVALQPSMSLATTIRTSFASMLCAFDKVDSID